MLVVCQIATLAGGSSLTARLLLLEQKLTSSSSPPRKKARPPKEGAGSFSFLISLGPFVCALCHVNYFSVMVSKRVFILRVPEVKVLGVAGGDRSSTSTDGSWMDRLLIAAYCARNLNSNLLHARLGRFNQLNYKETGRLTAQALANPAHGSVASRASLLADLGVVVHAAGVTRTNRCGIGGLSR